MTQSKKPGRKSKNKAVASRTKDLPWLFRESLARIGWPYVFFGDASFKSFIVVNDNQLEFITVLVDMKIDEQKTREFIESRGGKAIQFSEASVLVQPESD